MIIAGNGFAYGVNGLFEGSGEAAIGGNGFKQGVVDLLHVEPDALIDGNGFEFGVTDLLVIACNGDFTSGRDFPFGASWRLVLILD